MKKLIQAVAVVLLLCVSATPVFAATLTVGPGKQFRYIEDANVRAKPGDVVLVFPLKDNKPYEKVAIYVRRERITFRGVVGKDGRRVRVSGKGFKYSGRGRIPRAIFQFNGGGDGGVLEGFELFGAHNKSHNGAGVRINQANNVTIRNCEIHHNDMGIMSNGNGLRKAAINQLIESCIIHHNGDPRRPGYNHNLYLGGTSVTLRFSEVHSSLTGHNVKSRAHYTRIEYCYIHDSANRELDLVDARDTAGPGSHAVLIGNVIAKDPACPGNRGVIHFGQDGGGEHEGTIFLVHNTIITPFVSPVVELSAPKARAKFIGNIIYDGRAKQKNQTLTRARAGANPGNVTGTRNWLSAGFGNLAATSIDPRKNLVARSLRLPFVSPAKGDYRLGRPVRGIVNAGMAAKDIRVPAVPGASRG
ncbi:MAG: right-handed parallel beta-helix repeat-containing protein, partial [Phycisphaerae bacterium]|nr:right-handed parallel beta-helix repeat-containing protein [Phycisphaerae bacterium]